MKTISELREDYVNQFRKLQQKHRENKTDFIILALLLAYFIDYIETKNESKYFLIAPFIPKIKNIDNAKAIANSVDKGLSGKGVLGEYVIDFKEKHKNIVFAHTSIIPNLTPKIKKKGEKQRLIDLENELILREAGNRLDLEINQRLFGKKMKKWNSQRDSRVRKTAFHNGVDGQTVGIDEMFESGGFKARYPSDSANLQPYDTYGCRCYLTYFY